MDTRTQAELLAGQGYFYLVSQDETTAGEPTYIAQVLELPGCLGQGETFDLAIADAKAAVVDYIESLLQDGQAVPAPRKGKLIWRPAHAPSADQEVIPPPDDLTLLKPIAV